MVAMWGSGSVGWWRVLVWAVGLLAGALVEGGALADTPHPVAGVQVLGHARFEVPGHEPLAVDLPDQWSQRGLASVGQGRYRMAVDLDTAPTGLWALGVDRLSTERSIEVNGMLLDESSARAGRPSRARTVPVLVSVPPGVLRQGRNELLIELRAGSQFGLEAPVLGPMDLVRPDFQRRMLWATTVPQLLNAAFAALALFMMLIWVQRRGERSIGLFGTLAFLVAARNYSYYLERGVLAPAVNDWLYYAAQCASVALLGAFAVSMSIRPWPGLRRIYWGVGTVLPVLAVPMASVNLISELRTWTYPLLLVVATTALWILGQAARRLRGTAMAAMWLGLVAVVLSGAHDYLVVAGVLSHYFWIPITFPLALGAFAIMLLNRLVQAMGQVEAMSEVLEARVAERTAELERANAAQSRFLAAASHDLRQPVAAMGLLSGLVRDRAAASPAVRPLADRLVQAAAALESQLSGLLDLSRLDLSKAAPQRAPVPLQSLFDAVEAHEAWRARQRDVRLRVRPTTAIVDSDPVLLEQILRNLVGNALQHTTHGGVLVAARHRGAVLSLQVWDSGPGIAEQDQQRIFEAFVQLDNPARMRERGLGLGLALVRRAAQVLGHAIDLRSVPGRGSRFSIDLPVSAIHAAPQGTAGSGPLNPDALAGVSVLLVEDDPVVLAAIAEQLRAWGLLVQVDAGEDFDAIAAAARTSTRPFDLLVSDRRLPGGDGIDLAKRLRNERGGPLPALIVTGDVVDDVQTLLEGTDFHLLRKPFAAQDLWRELVALVPVRVSVA